MARYVLMTAAALGALLWSDPTVAKDLGTHGPVFEIAEPSILDAIHDRLRGMVASGELDQMRQDMEDTTRAYVQRPRPVAGLTRAVEDRYFAVDLSITVERDLTDHRGVVFARAGDVINPLDYSMFGKRIVMLDGDDPEQVAYALSHGTEIDTLLILTNGEPLALTKQHGRRFYFDQDGVISSRFAITALPAEIVRGQGVMNVHEVALGRN